MQERNIEYFILDESSRDYLIKSGYMKWDGSEKHFEKIAHVKDKYYIGYRFPEDMQYYYTEIYKITY